MVKGFLHRVMLLAVGRVQLKTVLDMEGMAVQPRVLVIHIGVGHVLILIADQPILGDGVAEADTQSELEGAAVILVAVAASAKLVLIRARPFRRGARSPSYPIGIRYGAAPQSGGLFIFYLERTATYPQPKLTA